MKKKLREGYTTGTCAAAAAKAATYILLTGKKLLSVTQGTPEGRVLSLKVENIQVSRESVSCGVRKDGGDDIDVTDGILVCAAVSRASHEGVSIDGGDGVGRVTKTGLDQPVGAAAINHVPRAMIRDSVAEAAGKCGYTGGIDVIIFVPGGEEIAGKTFNPRLGIRGGISILGTSGIVKPMSEKALLDAIRIEMRMHRENSGTAICLTPGNYGEKFAFDFLKVDPEKEMQCSNFVGDALDMAAELGFEEVLFVSHIGKFIKVSGGIMNTHSHEADCRMELMAAAAIRAGADAGLARNILDCNTTDDAVGLLSGQDGLLEKTMHEVMQRISFYLDQRCGGDIRTGAVVYSAVHGLLGKTDNAEAIIRELQ
ncbi:MAG: cobalt-precorrin-5B (C(1))-methyltransferase CbiD [Eubacteriales bacterium]|jgi:cobalt-precorrin-5B (C1)-methyltransferase